MYYKKSINQTLEELKSSETGLSQEEARLRLKQFGYNELKKKKRLSALKIFLSQFKDPIIYILIIAVLISLAINHKLDATVIAAILFINAILGFSQEFKAERALAMLKKISAPKSRVLRDNKQLIIAARELVPGDILLLEQGDKISADARLIHIINLETDESILTGESTPVIKEISKINLEKVPIAEQSNMVFSGTIITNGRGKAIVTNTGMQTEIGKIAELVQVEEETKTPLQKKLSNLGKVLGIIVLAIAIFVFLIGMLTRLDLFEMFLVAISLAVSAIPEGLPVVVTVALAIGVRVMLKRKVLVRKLRAIETLGSTTVICSDKTGTLTKNEMTVTELFVNDKSIGVTGKGYETKGDFLIENKKADPKNFSLFLEIMASCNNSVLPNIGDPTEIALLVAAAKAKILGRERIGEIPFDSKKKYMVTLHRLNGKNFSYIKGAPEKVLELCSYVNINGDVKKLTSSEKKKILSKNKELASKALRVIAVAYKEDKKIENLIFVGLAGMIDPPRPEVKNAIKLCKLAGIRPIMVTGDNRDTAIAVAKQIGIKGGVLTGSDLDKITNTELLGLVDKIGIYARVDPEHKVRILEALQSKGEVVAMTGDGVNDAPALKEADVGVSMSIKSTDVAREASDIVLLDDNFASIIKAIKEGRHIYDNIKKFVKFLLAANSGEILIILFAILVKLPLPLLPLQILWLNLVTDSFPALALSVEPVEKDIMQRKPRSPKEHILNGTWIFIIIAGILAAIVTMIAFFIGYNISIEKARTMALTTTIVFELFFVFTCRTDKSVFSKGIFSNRAIIYGVLIALALQLTAIYSPLNIVFKLTQLNLIEWVKILALSSVGFIFFEIKKVIKK